MMIWTVGAAAQTVLPDPRMHALAAQGIDLTWQQKYREADSVFQSLIKEYPDHPAGYVYRAGVIQTRAVDHELQVDQQSFDSLLVLAKERAKAMIEAGGNDTRWGYFYLGSAEGCDSYARVYRGDWMGGAMRGVASFSAFKDAIDRDATLYDACAGIGGFYYWRSRKTEHFNWLPFVGDDRPKAFPLLANTVEHGVYNRYTALSMLVAIYTDAGNYDKAIECAQVGLERYPSNQVFLWGLTTALRKSGKTREAITSFERLLASLEEEEGENGYNEFVCRLNIATLRMEIGDTDHVRQYLTSILKLKPDDFPSHLRERIESKLEQAKDLQQKLGAVRSSRE
ncbi:MAG: bacterial transcriptional activator domain-containing protein [Ignavibacteriales bacterium]|nr:bacterial transcriptional activator domain-containing protein [Ignavibacteriales bacterium]